MYRIKGPHYSRMIEDLVDAGWLAVKLRYAVRPIGWAMMVAARIEKLVDWTQHKRCSIHAA
jgi:TRAP-type C4-dicarboxylate transport system permease small subunit